MDTLDRQARGELRQAKKAHGGHVPDHVLTAIEQGSEVRADRKQRRGEKRAEVRGYFSDQNRLARLVPLHCAITSIATGAITASSGDGAWAGAVAAPIAAGIIWFNARDDLDTPTKKIYAATAISYVGLWSTAVAHGIAWNGLGHAALVAGAAILSAPWAYKNLWRWQAAPPPVQQQPAEQFSWFRETWEMYRPIDAKMVNEVEIDNGHQAELVVERGKKSTEDILGAARLIASAYDKPPTQVIVEPAQDGRASRARLTVLDRDVLADVRSWTGPTLNTASGVCVAGNFPDGALTHWEFWAPSSGASHSLIAGEPGSGKSRFADKLLAEVHLTPLIIPWVMDPQEGQSLPDWAAAVDRIGVGVDGDLEAVIKVLRAGYRVMVRRAAYLSREIEWVDAKGRPRKGGKTFFDPTLEMPLLEIFLDEAPVLLQDPVYGPEALAILGPMSKQARKTGIGITLFSQLPSLDELGGSKAAVLRAMLRQGNVASFRTGESVSQYMLGLAGDPSQLPQYFADGKRTHGLGLIKGPDNRPATPWRSEFIEDPLSVAEQPAAGALDAMSAEAADAPDDIDLAPKTFVVPGFGHQQPTPLIPDAKEKQTWADKVLPLFADGREHQLGEVINAFPSDASDRSIRWGVKKLVTDRLLTTAGEKKPYRITDAGVARLEQLRDATAVA